MLVVSVLYLVHSWSVKIANGTLTEVLGEGSIYVLLKDPLLSFYIFPPSHCVFQDLRMGLMIGGGCENSSLYILELRIKESGVLRSAIAVEIFLLWH